jgi:tellurite methyltransferase
MNHNELYSIAPKVYGFKPAALTVFACKLLAKGNLSALDIGAGQGRDSLYLSRQGFAVTAVDIASVGLEQISVLDKKIKTVCTDIATYDFERNYDLIISINTLHFLPKTNALAVIEKIKKHVNGNGIIAISVLLDNGKFVQGELKSLFDDFEILKYEEKTIHDKAHPGAPKPHDHKIAKIAVRM